MNKQTALHSDATTQILLGMSNSVSWDTLPNSVRNAARRHFLDTAAAMVAGAAGDVAQATRRSAGASADVLSIAFQLGTAAHGVELDDGHRGGSVHPGVAVVPALVALSRITTLSGPQALAAMVVGYEVICSVSAASNPALRQHGFHPTSAVGPLGASLAVAHALGLNDEQSSNALAFAATSAGGLFAFLGGGADMKRLHGGYASRNGLDAALLAAEGISGPANILDSKPGWFDSFTGQSAADVALSVPPEKGFNILDCYLKPYSCCRHLQPAMEALINLRNEHGLTSESVAKIEVETYTLAAGHTKTGWDTMADAQLSFPYCLSVSLKEGRANLPEFTDEMRNGDWVQGVVDKIAITSSQDMDDLYPQQRPARVTVSTSDAEYSAFLPEASGSPEYPMSDDGVQEKAYELFAQVLDPQAAQSLVERLWRLEDVEDVSELFAELM